MFWRPLFGQFRGTGYETDRNFVVVNLDDFNVRIFAHRCCQIPSLEIQNMRKNSTRDSQEKLSTSLHFFGEISERIESVETNMKNQPKRKPSHKRWVYKNVCVEERLCVKASICFRV